MTFPVLATVHKYCAEFVPKKNLTTSIESFSGDIVESGSIALRNTVRNHGFVQIGLKIIAADKVESITFIVTLDFLVNCFAIAFDEEQLRIRTVIGNMKLYADN